MIETSSTLRLHRRLWLQPLEARTAPATFTVQSLADSGLGSLRGTIGLANGTPGADTIDFKAGLSGTITLTGGEIAIGDELTINGPGASLLAISGNNSSRVFNTSTSIYPITISGLTLTQCKSSSGPGGAIIGSNQAIYLHNCDLKSNSTSGNGGAVALTSSGYVRATECTFSFNHSGGLGGAVAVGKLGGSNSGNSNFENCTLLGNTALEGGAVFAVSGIDLANCTISSNIASDGRGGGLFLSGFDNTPGPPNNVFVGVFNSTITGNTAKTMGGGVFATHPGPGLLYVYIANATIASNSAFEGGGLTADYALNQTQINSSIIAKNTGGNLPDIYCTTPTTIAGDDNIIGVANVGNFTLPGTGHQFGTLALPLNPMLSPLGEFGGPTKTLLPLPGSPAIDKGHAIPTILGMYDQRNFARTAGARTDVGAVESDAALMVDTIVDEIDGNYATGDLSLREAVDLCNTMPLPVAAIAFDPDVFAFPRTIALSLGEMTIADALTISGPAAELVIDAKSLSRIFNTQLAPTNAPIAISDLSFTGGKGSSSGGAIVAGDEQLTLERCDFVNNGLFVGGGGGGAVGVTGGGTLTATDCTFTISSAPSSGGAIRVAGGPNAATVLTRCSVTGNFAPGGGAIYAHGYLNLESCTVASNTASTGRGGGILFNPVVGGGGIFVRNSTISGNSAKTDGGGIALTDVPSAATVFLRSSTITQNKTSANGGGLARTDGLINLILDATIVAQNTSTLDAPDIFVKSATNVSGNNNLIGVADKGNFTLTGSGNQNGTAALPLNAQLEPLTNNGGPTATHIPQGSSLVINKGGSVAPSLFDQRGAPRLSGPALDVGAVEYQLPNSFLVDIVIDEVDGNFAKGDLSLREALALANASPESADSISFDPLVFIVPKTISLANGELVVSTPVAVFGPGAARLTINANQASRVFNLAPAVANTAISLNGMTITAGKTLASGGGIYSDDEMLALNDCDISFNGAAVGGGVASHGSLAMTACTISYNFAGNAGGGVVVSSKSAPSVVSSTLTENRAPTAAGLMFVAFGNTGSLLIEQSTISGNSLTGSGEGGGILFTYAYGYVTAGALTLRNTTISGNSGYYGGGVNINAGTLVVQNCTVTANSASKFGGGIFRGANVSSAVVESSIVAQNSSAGAPDIFSQFGVVNVNYSLIGSSNGFVLTGANNLPFGSDPGLLPLANYGGPTKTHALKTDSLCIDKGSNALSFINDQRGGGFLRTKLGGTDIGAVEWQGPVPTATIQINDGSVQRSMVTSITVTFSEPVSFPDGMSAAFQLVRTTAPISAVNLAFNQIGNEVAITFDDPVNAPAAGAKSLVDGNYTLTLVADKIQGANGLFDGNGDAYGGDDRVLSFHRLFGDADGDRDVDASDYGLFRTAFGGGSSAIFDFEGDDDVDVSDYAQFRTRFGDSI